jgi:catechol 2,3-dioxygenase-like lactoylglutathione lyase family enzyme
MGSEMAVAIAIEASTAPATANDPVSCRTNRITASDVAAIGRRPMITPTSGCLTARIESRRMYGAPGTTGEDRLRRVSDPPEVTGISELVLEVADLERSRRFYRDVLGFEETMHGERRDDRRWYLIAETARLGLWSPQVGLAGGRGGAHVHFALHVDDAQIEKIQERIEGLGVGTEGPMQLGPGRALYVTDPDGNVVEFWSQDMAEYTAAARRAGD